MSIPTLETDRLILRAHQAEDFNSSHEMWSHPEIVKYISGKPSTEQQSWSRIMTYLGHWQLMGYGYWAVVEKASGLFAGEIGFADFKRDLQPSIKSIPEIGWALKWEMHGKGYATEALKAIQLWGDQNLDSDKTVCLINPSNLASLKVATKLGYREWTKTTYNDAPVILFERMR